MMDASGGVAVYYSGLFSSTPSPLPSLGHDEQRENHIDEQGIVSRPCSVKGCNQSVQENSQNKMCEACRGRHRIYATTKRARRKLEKAAVANVVAARSGLAYTDMGESGTSSEQPIAQHAPWISPTGDILNQENIPHSSTSNVPSSMSPSLPTAPWNDAIDPRLFAAGSQEDPTQAPLHHIPPPGPHQTTSTSELANALTLPTPARPAPSRSNEPYYSSERLQPQSSQPRYPPEQIASFSSHTGSMDNGHDGNVNQGTHEAGSTLQDTQTQVDSGQLDSSVSTSTSANNAQEPLQHSTAAEPPETKDGPLRFCSVKGCKAVIPATYEFKMCPPCRTRYRTYGNTKRAKWKAEREAFDREMAGLRAIEDSRRKEKGLPSLAERPEELRAWELSIIDEQIPLPVLMTTQTPAAQTAPETANQPLDPSSPIAVTTLFQHSVSSIDTPHSVSPYPHLNNPLLSASAPPLPARMCTVSHCHKVLPGYYRYKRCEQHRLQNRHHSKLKRVREKVSKASGPEEGATPLDIPDDTPQEVEVNKTGERKGKGKSKANGKVADSEKGMEGDGGQQNGLFMTFGPGLIEKGELEPKEKEKLEKHANHSCINDTCHNPLNPGTRWRTCDECRLAERRRKSLAKQEAKQAEGTYWKDLSSEMNPARVVSEPGTAVPVANPHSQSVGGAAEISMGGQDRTENAEENKGEDEDATGSESESETEHEAQPQPQVPPEKKHAPQPLSGFSNFSVFRVGPQPNSSVPLAAGITSTSELITLDDPIAFRAYIPKTTTSAIGRILASNPEISVDAFSDVLKTQGQPDTSSSAAPSVPTPSSGTVPAAATSSSTPVGVSTTALKPIMTPTIPTSAPFVYKAPPKKFVASTPSALAKEQTIKKSKRQSSSAAAKSSSKATTAPPGPASASPTPCNPYTYVPHYPYPYPYYMPPYGVASYPNPPVDPNQKPIASSSSSSSSYSTSAPPPPPSSVPGYQPYPYSYPHAYGYPPPGSYPYVAQRYIVPPYVQSGPPGSSTSTTYPYYPGPQGLPAVVAPPVVKPPPKPAPPKDPKFSFYHYGLGTSDSPTNPAEQKPPRKRRKVDPNYLEKYRAQIQAKNAASTAIDVPQSGVPVESREENRDAMRPRPEPSAPTISNVAEATPVTDANQRKCGNKSCSRLLPSDTSGTICEKCKLRVKKHQARMKQKFKLVPRKSVLRKSSSVKPQDQDGSESGSDS